MTEFDNRRTVTNGAQRGAAMSVHYPSGQGPDNMRYVEAISRYQPGLCFSSRRVNENAMQPGHEHFLVDNSCVGGSQTVPHSARREPRYQNVKSLFIRLMKEVAVRPHSYLVMSFGNTETDLNRKLVVLQESWKKCGMFTQQKIVKAK